MPEDRQITDKQLADLIGRARGVVAGREPHLALGAAYAWRIAHLLDQMVAASAHDLDELVLLATRPAMEAGVYGRFYVTHPDEYTRVLGDHRAALERIAPHFEAPSFPEISESFKGALNWDQALADYERSRSPGRASDVTAMKAWYGALSSTTLHAGLGTVQRYMVEGEDGEAEIVANPSPTIDANGCLDLIGALLGSLLEVLEAAGQDLTAAVTPK